MRDGGDRGRTPGDCGPHRASISRAIRRKQWGPALDELHAAERLAPMMLGIRLNIALVYYRQADAQHAIAPFESVLRDQPDSHQARYLLGLCYFFKERYAECRQDDRAVVAAGVGQSELPVRDVHRRQQSRPCGSGPKATARLIEAGHDSAASHLTIGKAHAGAGLYAQAMEEFQTAVRLDPKLPLAHYSVSAEYRRQNDLEYAKLEFLKDIAIAPDVVYDYDELGAASRSRLGHGRLRPRQNIQAAGNTRKRWKPCAPPAPSIRKAPASTTCVRKSCLPWAAAPRPSPSSLKPPN